MDRYRSLGLTQVVAPAEKVSIEQDLEMTQVHAGRGKSEADSQMILSAYQSPADHNRSPTIGSLFRHDSVVH